MSASARHNIDPVTLTVVWNKLISITDEMGGALRRTAFSEAVREGEDFSTGLFDRKGRLIAQGNFTPGHLGAMPYVVAHLLKQFPPETLREGDTIATNDSFLGGSHYPDFFLMTPIFMDGTIVAYVVNTAHHVDVGGLFPGSQAVQGVTEAYQEGIRVLPVRLASNWKLNDDLVRVILGNVRLPEKVHGDLKAQQNANFVGSTRVKELFREIGLEQVDAIIEVILDHSEARARELIAALPNGTFSFDDHLDDYGPGSEPIDVCVDVTIDGDTAVVDFSRSSDQVPAGLNCYINYTRAYGMFAMRIIAGFDVPHNAGVERVVKVEAREGCFFNAKFPAASGGRASVQVRIFDAVNGAMSKAVPERTRGAFTHWCNPNVGSHHKSRSNWVMYDLMFGGYGGRAGADGAEGMAPVMNCANIPVEVHETNNPVLIRQIGYMADTGGAGQYRGGCGLRKDVELRDAAVVTLLADRHRFPPYGLEGGQPGALARTILVRNGEEIELGSKEVKALEPGDILSFRLAGAGGYGDPARRDRALIEADIRNGYVTPDAAAAVSGYRKEAGAK
jgi:N-methylhydantoinase B